MAISPIDLTNIASGTGGFVIHGPDALDQSGFSVASAGDLNGDDFDDLIIGARHADAAGKARTNAGESIVIFGKATGFGASIDLVRRVVDFAVSVAGLALTVMAGFRPL